MTSVPRDETRSALRYTRLTPYSSVVTKRDSQKVAALPSPMPTANSNETRASTSVRTRTGVAPSAPRIPISVGRRYTSYAITPYTPRPVRHRASAPKDRYDSFLSHGRTQLVPAPAA